MLCVNGVDDDVDAIDKWDSCVCLCDSCVCLCVCLCVCDLVCGVHL